MSTNKTTNMEKYIYILEKYLLRFPVMLIVYLLGYFSVVNIMSKSFGLDPIFYACYTLFYFGLLIFIELIGRKQFIIPSFVLFTIVLILISRDIVLLINLVTALCFVILSLILIQDRFVKIGFTVFMVFNLILWISTGTNNRFIILCLFVGAIYIIGKHLKKDVDYGFIVIMSFIIICFLPVRDEPIKWTLVRTAMSHVETIVDNTIMEIGYRISGVVDIGNSFVGYSDNGTLTGGLKGSTKEELIFRKNGKCMDKKLYLKGAFYKTLTKDGLIDKESFDSTYNSWLVEYLNTLMNTEVDEDTALCFSKVESCEIEYRYLRTKDIICPANILKIDKELRDGLDRRVGKGFMYKVQYMAIDYGSPYYLEMLEKASQIDSEDYEYHTYSEARQYMKELYNVNLAAIMSEERYNEVRDSLINGTYFDGLNVYMDKSMSTDRIEELSAELTENAANDYEKAKVIEEYLRQFEYDRSVDLREEENYVDAFIFDVKKGYCVHFASAMVLMLRDAGIPARYVSGYMFKTENDTVLSNEAHAWVEAYIKGVGWMTFEPTPINPNAADLTWGRIRKEGSEKEYDREEAQKKFDEELARMEEEARRKAEMQMSSSASGDDSSDENGKKVDVRIVKKIVFYIGVILGTALGIILLLYLSRLIWFRLLTPEKKLQEMIRRTCRKIEKGIESEDEVKALNRADASLYDYLEYIEEETGRDRLKKMIDMYYISRFRGDKLTDQDVQSVINIGWLE